jgi:hypothetical protein
MKKYALLTLIAIAAIPLLVMGAHAALGGDEEDPDAPPEPASDWPCSFEPGESFCVSETGDVYYDGISRRNQGESKSGCVDGPASGFCTDETGKVSAGSVLPRDVCGNGTFRAPCSPEDVERLRAGGV